MPKYVLRGWLKVQSDYVPAEYGILKTIGPAFTVRSDYGRSDGSEFKRRIAMQVCQCDCGNVGIHSVNHLRRGNIHSCGCTRPESVSRTFTTHGDSNSVEYHAWLACKSRCYNKNNEKYHCYGGRGIRVCDRWIDPVNGYINFLADMGRRPPECNSVDRIEVNGNYEPGNCRWATQTEQMNNTRNTIKVTHREQTKGVTEWARQYGVCHNRLRYRIHKGMSLAEALSQLGVTIND